MKKEIKKNLKGVAIISYSLTITATFIFIAITTIFLAITGGYENFATGFAVVLGICLLLTGVWAIGTSVASILGTFYKYLKNHKIKFVEKEEVVC